MQQNFQISGDWTPADDSPNRLEVAPTNKEGVFALRDTYSPDDRLFVTGNQITQLAQQVQGGRLKNLIGQHGSGGGHQGTGQQGTRR